MKPIDAAFYIESTSEPGLWWVFKDKSFEAPAALQNILGGKTETRTSFWVYNRLVEQLGNVFVVSPERLESPKATATATLSIKLGLAYPVSIGVRSWTLDQFLDMDFTPLEGRHAHWSDPIWALPESFQPYFFGPGKIPQEALDRAKLVQSRPGMAEAWLLQWIEVDFGQRDEGVSLHATEADAQEVYTEKRASGSYSSGSGYYGPVDGVRPAKVMIPWDLFDRIQANEPDYLKISDPKKQGILLPYQ